ncbi:sedoheptulokinase [Pogona vitticeps]
MMEAPLKTRDEGLKPRVLVGQPSVVMGIDLGTTSVKAVLVEEADGGFSVVASCAKDTRADVGSQGDVGPQRNEQDVHKIITALNECLASLPPQQLSRVSHIGVCGQMHGIMFWKTGRGCKWTEHGDSWRFEPAEVSHLVTWQDARCGAHFLSSLPQPRSHLSVATGYGCATVFWYLKNSPDFLKPYDAAGTIHDYVVAMLCGHERPRMSVQNAASWGYFNTTSSHWNMDILGESHFPVRFLPEVVQPGGIAGHTSYAWHHIPKATQVGAALGDFQCSVYSCRPEDTDAVLNIGTSAQLTILMPVGFQPGDTPDPPSPVAYYPYFGNRYLAVAASLNGGNVIAVFVNMLLRWMAELGIQASESDLYPRVIQAAAAQADPGFAICPTVFGERHTPARLASVTGIAASGLSLGHVTRALCRGVIQNLHSMLPSERLREAGVRQILASGSGLSKNEAMRQEVEKAYPFPVIYGKDASAAVGAALAMLCRK